MERRRQGQRAGWRRWGGAVAVSAVALSPAHAQLVPDLRGDVEENVLGVQTLAETGVDLDGGARAGSGRATGLQPAPDARPAAGPLGGGPDLSAQLAGPTTLDRPDEDATGALITGSIDTPADDEDRFGRAERAAPVGPLETGAGGTDESPYAPLGLRIGTFDVTTTLDLGVTHLRTTSTFEDPGPPVALRQARSDSTVGEAELSVEAVADWSRHGLELGFDGRLPFRFSGDDDQEPSVTVDGALRLDIDRDSRLTASGFYTYSQTDPGSAAVADAIDPIRFPGVGTTNEPIVQTFGGALTAQRQAGLFAATAEVNALRQTVGDVRLSTGATISQDDLDFIRYGARLRGGYSVSPTFAPFVEVEVSQREMDQRPDTAGLDRNATRYALRLGTAFDRGEKLSGEVAIGYVREDIADASLADISGLSVSADVTWSPRRETDVDFGLATTTTTSSDAGTSGSLVYAGTLGVTHRARANLELRGEVSLQYEDVVGAGEDEVTAAGVVGATYWLNRFMGLTGRVGHERTFSDDPTEETHTSTAFVGIRLQR